MKGDPTATPFHPLPHHPLGRIGWPDIAGVADQRRCVVEQPGVLERRLDLDPDMVVLGQQRQQFPASEIDVVVEAAGHQHRIDPALPVRPVSH